MFEVSGGLVKRHDDAVYRECAFLFVPKLVRCQPDELFA